MNFKLQCVHYMPKELEAGVLYVSEEFRIALHLCACGCGAKIRTPLGPTEWSIEETSKGPSMRPSIGNWQQACRSHYWIYQGKIVWAEKWTPEQVAAGRDQEEERRRTHYHSIERKRDGIIQGFWRWIKSLFMAG